MDSPIDENMHLSMGTTRRSVAIMLIGMTALAIGLLFFVSLAYFKSLDREDASLRLSLYERSLNDNLERFQYFPFVLAQDPLVKGSLLSTNRQALNRRLAEFSNKSNLEAIYLMDKAGLVVAASNYDKEHSFVGHNYGFRPYFKQAISNVRGNYFGIGATTGRPGVFVSEPVKDAFGSIKGVIVIKLDVSELQDAWEKGGENVFVSNADEIIVMASNKDWLFRTLKPLTSKKLAEIIKSKKFNSNVMQQLSWRQISSSSVKLNNSSYIYATTKTKKLNWQLHYLLSEGRAYERSLLITIIFGSVISLLVGFATYLRSKRIQTAFAVSQSDRDQLLTVNQKLKRMHNELARSSKLAALGQLSASVVHELGLNRPLFSGGCFVQNIRLLAHMFSSFHNRPPPFLLVFDS